MCNTKIQIVDHNVVKCHKCKLTSFIVSTLPDTSGTEYISPYQWLEPDTVHLHYLWCNYEHIFIEGSK